MLNNVMMRVLRTYVKISLSCNQNREILDSDITLQELTDAVKQISLRHSPGIDGITTDFYHYFWNVLGQDFYEVAKECSAEEQYCPCYLKKGTWDF